MEIHNLYSLDIFLQGFFLLICILLGLYLVFKDNLETFKEIDSIHNFSKSLHVFVLQTINTLSLKSTVSQGKAYQYFGIIPLVIIFSFISGILGNSIADEWIDSKNQNHLGLKLLWGKENLINLDSIMRSSSKKKINKESNIKYKNLIRIESFKTVFNHKVNDSNKRFVEQLYYHSKHEIIKSKNYYSYMRKSQTISEYSRIFALGFFFLFLCSLLNLFIMFVRALLGDTNHQRSFNKSSEEDENNEQDSENIKLVSVSNLVILVFGLISFLTIWFFANPKFNNLTNYISYTWFIYILVYFGCFTFLLFIFKRFRNLRFSFFIYSIIYVISLVGYFSSAKIWVSSESQVSRKVFGLYKSTHLGPNIEEIKYAKKLNLIKLYSKKDSLND